MREEGKIPFTKYFCKKDATKRKPYRIVTGQIFREWKGSGFTDFKDVEDGEGGVIFKHSASEATVYVYKDGIGNVAVQVSCDSLEHKAYEAFVALEGILDIRLVSRRPFVR